MGHARELDMGQPRTQDSGYRSQEPGARMDTMCALYLHSTYIHLLKVD